MQLMCVRELPESTFMYFMYPHLSSQRWVALKFHLSFPQVCSQPYQADSQRKCRDETTEYVTDDSDLCCKKCPPGKFIK